MSTKTLLPPYMQSPVWQDLFEALDNVFATEVDAKLMAMRYLRSTFVADFGDESKTVGQKVAAREFLLPTDFDVFDEQTERLRLNQLGLKLGDPSIVSLPPATPPTLLNSPVHRLVQYVGQFWFEKGKGNFIDFINFCLNTKVTMVALWTRDYINFYPESDEIVGQYVWNGGAWYPTTHVRLDLTETTIAANQLRDLLRLFYDIANFNLVLEGVLQSVWADVVSSVDYLQTGGPVEGPPGEYTTAGADIVSIGLHQSRTDKFETPFYPGPPY